MMAYLDNTPYFPDSIVCMEVLQELSKLEKVVGRDGKRMKQELLADLAHLDMMLKRLAKGGYV